MAILTWIVELVLKLGIGSLTEWLKNRSLNKAQKQKDSLEVAIEATAEAEKQTEKYKKLVEDHEKAAAKVTTLEEKLTKIREFNNRSKTKNEEGA